MANKIPAPEKFKGEEDSARRFFQRFELYAAAKEWTDDAKKATQVMLLLGDTPFDYAIELGEATRASYANLKKAIVSKYESGDLADNYILRFQGFRFRQGDDPLLGMSQLRQLAEKAYPDMAAAAREAVVMSQFVLSLPAELRRQVHLLPAKPENAAALVEKVKLFAQVDGALTGGACARVEESGLSQVISRIEELSRELEALKSEDDPTVARMAASGGARGGGRGFNRGGRGFNGTCYRCGESGHMARDCRQKGSAARPASASSETLCFTCGNGGHRSFECAVNIKGKLCLKCGNTGHEKHGCNYSGRSLN